MALVGSGGAHRVPSLLGGDLVVSKTRDSAFHRTELLAHLQEASVSALVVAGVSTESCIALTCADAYAWDFPVTIVADATAASDPTDHESVLDRLTTLYRQKTKRSADIDFRGSALPA